MATPSARSSFRYALNGELMKLYGVILLGFVVLDVSSDAFHIVGVQWIRALVRTPFVLVGWGLIAGGVVGVLHYILSDTLGETTNG